MWSWGVQPTAQGDLGAWFLTLHPPPARGRPVLLLRGTGSATSLSALSLTTRRREFPVWAFQLRSRVSTARPVTLVCTRCRCRVRVAACVWGWAVGSPAARCSPSVPAAGAGGVTVTSAALCGQGPRLPLGWGVTQIARFAVRKLEEESNRILELREFLPVTSCGGH